MKHETTTFNTQKMLAASLKGFMEKKPLSKITVSEIITDCGVNRKTFYYHFSDIYSLLKWMLEQEAIDEIKSRKEQDPNKTVEYLSLILENALPGILKNAPQTSGISSAALKA